MRRSSGVVGLSPCAAIAGAILGVDYDAWTVEVDAIYAARGEGGPTVTS